MLHHLVNHSLQSQPRRVAGPCLVKKPYKNCNYVWKDTQTFDTLGKKSKTSSTPPGITICSRANRKFKMAFDKNRQTQTSHEPVGYDLCPIINCEKDKTFDKEKKKV